MADPSIPEISPSVAKEQSNVTFIEENPVGVVNATPEPGKMEIANDTGLTISELDWDRDTALNKPIKVATLSWTTTMASGSTIPIFDGLTYPLIPLDFLNKNVTSMVTNILKSFTFAKYTPYFQIQVNSTKFNIGELWIGYIPFSERAFPQNETQNLIMLDQWPHVSIDASEPLPVEFDIPWFHPQNCFNQTYKVPGTRALGYMWCVVLAPLAVPSGASSSVEVILWMGLRNTKLHVPIHPSLTIIDPVPATAEFMRRNGIEPEMTLKEQIIRLRGRFPRARINLDEDEEDDFLENHGGSVSSLWNSTMDAVGSVGDAVDKAVNLDFSGAIGDFGNAIDKGLNAAESGAELAAMFDRPRCPKTEIAIRQQSGPFQYGIGSDTSIRLSLNPFDHYAPKRQHIGNFGQEHSFRHRLSKYCFWSLEDWTSTQTTGTLISTYELWPNWYYQGGCVTPLTYIANQFNFWKGSLKFKIKVVASQFHSGRLQVVYANAYGGEVPAYNESMSWPTTTIDLSNKETREYEVVCPYNSAFQCLNAQYPTSGGGDGSMLTQLTSLGRLLIYVLIPLQHTESIATTVHLKVSIAGGDDLVFFSPRNPYMLQYDVGSPNTDFAPAPPAGETYNDQFYNHGLMAEVFIPPAAEAENHSDTESVLALEGAERTVSEIKRRVDLQRAVVMATVDQWRGTPEGEEKMARVNILSNLASNLIKISGNMEQARSMMLQIQMRETFSPSIGSQKDAENHSDPSPTSPPDAVAHLMLGNGTTTHHESSKMIVTDNVLDVSRRYGFLLTFINPGTHSQFQRIWTLQPNALGKAYIFGQTLIVPVTPLMGDPRTCPVAYNAVGYIGWYGSLRYKMTCKNSQIDNYQITILHHPDQFLPVSEQVGVRYYAERPNGYAATNVNITDKHTIEFEIPYRSPMLWLGTTRCLGTDAWRYYGMNGTISIGIDERHKVYDHNIQNLPVDRSPYFEFDLYMAAGDDFRFVYERPPLYWNHSGPRWNGVPSPQEDVWTVTTTTALDQALPPTVTIVEASAGFRTTTTSSSLTPRHYGDVSMQRPAAPARTSSSQQSLASRAKNTSRF